MTDWNIFIERELERLKTDSVYRELRVTERLSAGQVRVDDKNLLNYMTNDYLQLAQDIRLKSSQIEAAWNYGTGSTGSRYVAGNHRLYPEAEAALGEWKNREGLILNSGYTANIGVLTSLLGRHDSVFSDRLNHASIVDGIQLSGARFKRYRHVDMNHLESLLKQAPERGKRLIVTDTVFSMDGDLAPLDELVFLKEKYNALLVVDEAHATGLFGEDGRGLVSLYGLEKSVDIQMGTFSKALGSLGAYVVASPPMLAFLRNKMRSLIFTTALPPVVVASIKAAIHLMETTEFKEKRAILHKNSGLFREQLKEAGFDVCGSASQIVPVLVGSNEKAMQFQQELERLGIGVAAIRPPTVPEGTARLRFALHSGIEACELDRTLRSIITIGEKLGVVKG